MSSCRCIDKRIWGSKIKVLEEANREVDYCVKYYDQIDSKLGSLSQRCCSDFEAAHSGELSSMITASDDTLREVKNRILYKINTRLPGLREEKRRLEEEDARYHKEEEERKRREAQKKMEQEQKEKEAAEKDGNN